jgi:hypothetical protein
MPIEKYTNNQEGFVMDALRYPIGRYRFEGMNAARQEKWISELEELPKVLRETISGLDDSQLDLAYRKGGWSSRQVVHHLADAIINNYSRFKLALTESNPTIKPFDEEAWAATEDGLHAPTETSISMIEGTCARWALLLRSLDRADFEREFYHPGKGRQFKLSYYLGYVTWHARHHVAHISGLRERNNW